MKIFISMPMKSKSTEQVKKEMNDVFNYIKERLPDVELIDSVIEWADRDIALKWDSIAIWYLSKSLELMSKADLVFFVDWYKDYRWCNAERFIAEKYWKFCIDFKFIN